MKHPTNWLNSLGYALNGFRFAMEERNFRFHVLAALSVCIASYLLQLSTIEWALILSAIALVCITELINTVTEHLCDLISMQHVPLIKRIKDMAAAAVLISAVYALGIAACILLPKLMLHF